MTFEKVETTEHAALGWLKDGSVVIDRHNSHIDHNNPNLDYLEDALAEVDPNGKAFHMQTITFNEDIGVSVCVPTTTDDEIVFAQRPHRNGLTRFVKNRQPIPTNELMVILKKSENATESTYVLITAFAGPQAEPEPWDTNATNDSRIFWASHALIYQPEEVVPETETTVCPWWYRLK